MPNRMIMNYQAKLLGAGFQDKSLFKFIMFDVCHNEQGFQYTLDRILKKFGKDSKINIVINVKANKEIQFENIIERLEHESIVNIYPTRTNNSWSADPNDLKRELDNISTKISQKSIVVENGDIDEIMKFVCGKILQSKKQEGVLICGSFYMMSHVKTKLGYQQNIDSEEMEEVKGNDRNYR